MTKEKQKLPEIKNKKAKTKTKTYTLKNLFGLTFEMCSYIFF